MSNNLDIASEREEIARRSALLTSRKPEGPVASGHCLYCGVKVPFPMRWCNATCRDGYVETRPR